VQALLKSVAKKTAYVTIAIIVLMALAMIVGRILAPLLDQHRTDFEKWASELLQAPVTIQQVRASWYGYQPVISFNEVTVMNKETHQPILQVQKVKVLLSIPQSIWQRQWVQSGILISGSDVKVQEKTNGEIDILGFPTLHGFQDKPFQQETKMTEVLGWLSQQPRLILRDVNVHFTGLAGEKRFVTLYNLRLENSGAQHHILGKAILHQDIPTEVNLVLQWEGQTVDFNKIKANAYIYLSGLSLSQWLKERSWNGWRINQGVISAKLWMTWDQGAFQKMQSDFQLYGLDLYSATDKSLHKINRLSGNVGWKREGDHDIIAGDDILIDLSAHLWPVTNFYLSLKPQADGSFSPQVLHLGYVDLNDVQTFLFASPWAMPAPLKQALLGLQLTGGLQNLSVAFSPTGPWQDWNQLKLSANFAQVSVSPWKTYPGISNLSGMVKWNGSQGELSLNSSRSTFQYDAVFLSPLHFDQLFGDMQFHQDPEKAWVVQIPSLQVLNSDTTANVNGSITIPEKTSPLVDIKANFALLRADHITRYLPMHTFEPGLVKWLQQAFLSGEVKSGSVILRGALSDFPFDQNKGVFSITGLVNNVDFRFAPDWPLLKHVTGKLSFTSREMIAEVDSAEMVDIRLSKVRGVIPDFGSDKPQVLQTEVGEIPMDFAQGLHFIHASPLEKTIGKMFTGVQMHGAMTLTLGLTVPLKTPEQTQVRGAVAMNNVQMNLLPWHLTLDHMKGHFQFTEQTTTANDIQGEVFNQPLTLSLATVQKTKQLSVVQASFNTHLNIKDLEEWLKIPLSETVQGATDVKGEIDFSLNAPVEIRLHSNLVGVGIQASGPYAKSMPTAQNFAATIFVADKQPLRLQLSLEKSLSAALILERKLESYHLIAANIGLGEGTPAWPTEPGLYLTGQFERLDWDTIKPYVDQAGGDTHFAGLSLRRVDISAGVVNIAGLSMPQLHVQITPAEAHWDVTVNSPDINGTLQIPAHFTAQEVINAQFQKLSLHSVPETTKTPLISSVKSLPSILFTANNVSFNAMPLGRVTFKTAPSANGMTIPTLRINSPRLNLQASGAWIQNKTNYTTQLQGSASSSRVSDLLMSFGLNASNFVASDGRLTFKLNWQGAPYSPTLANLNGQASLDLGKGRIVDIGEESGAKMDLGRMLSIFSLQTIPRRLSLDFSDVFQKGYSFDSVRGDFSFQGGNANTRNLRFEGPVAKVSIDGRIGLKNKDYNFILSVTPYVTSSIPIAATLITGNPLVGAAAFAVNTIIGSQVSKVSTYYYIVTGTWDNPTWKEVSASGK